MKKEIRLRVGELTAREDYGRNIVRIDAKSMQELNVKENDVVEIKGKQVSGAIVARAYPGDVGLGIVRMDGLTRKNCGAAIGEYVSLRKAEVQEAKVVVLAPAEKDIRIEVSPSRLKHNLYARVLHEGDIIAPIPPRREEFFEGFERFFPELSSLFYGYGELKFLVVKTEPKGIVRVTDLTELRVLPELPKGVLEKKVPMITYEDIGGLKEAIQKIREMVELPLRHPELFERLGIEPPKGVLLYGPPGCGKTLLAKAVANEADAYFISISGPEIMSKYYGESEKRIRSLFNEAEKNAPSIVFIDEIDSLAPKREEVVGEVEKRVVAQLLACMDGLKSRGKVVVIAATNRPDALDPALRRPGRFDREIEIPVPDAQARLEILKIHTRNMPLTKDVNLQQLADNTIGFTGADLAAVCREAAMHCLRRVLPEIKWKEKGELPKEILGKLVVTPEDFEHALRILQPSAMREVLVEIPRVKWEEVGGLEGVKQELKESIEWPLKDPKAFKRLGIEPPKGVLLYGPPGCGKTLLAKAVATEAKANFISVKAPEVLSMWLGESEKRIREIFRRARLVAPAIVFIDEIEAITPIRGSYVGTRAYETILSQLLLELSGIQKLEGVIVLAATNRPDLVDPALLRPGRFDKLIYVPPPSEHERLEILKVHTRNMPLADVDLKDLAKRTEGYSGADLEALCREAAMTALRESMKSEKVRSKHFEQALAKIKPSLSKEIVEFYEKFEQRLKLRATREAEARYVV